MVYERVWGLVTIFFIVYQAVLFYINLIFFSICQIFYFDFILLYIFLYSSYHVPFIYCSIYFIFKIQMSMNSIKT